jgi:hypothetical protein
MSLRFIAHNELTLLLAYVVVLFLRLPLLKPAFILEPHSDMPMFTKAMPRSTIAANISLRYVFNGVLGLGLVPHIVVHPYHCYYNP